MPCFALACWISGTRFFFSLFSFYSSDARLQGCLLGLPGLSQIKVNPVAVTFAKKALERVLDLAKLQVPPYTH